MQFPYSNALYDALDKTIELLETAPYQEGEVFPDSDTLSELLQIPSSAAQDVLLQLRNLGRLLWDGNTYRVSGPPFFRKMWTMSSLTVAAKERELPITSNVLAFEITEAPKSVSTALSLSLGDLVYRLYRLRTVGSNPSLETSYLPVSMFDGLLQYDFSVHSLYAILQQKYGIRAEEQSQSLVIERPTEEEAMLLHITPSDAVLTVSGSTKNQMGIVFEYSIAKTLASHTVYEAKPFLKGLYDIPSF